MPKISVIIPVYNTAAYLPQCLDSVLGQTFKDIEVICVDDGSTDSSTDILQSYSEKDSRIKIIKQQNKYAGAARNAGLRQAAGEYVIFWDSDDYFKETALEEMYTKAQETDADICICNAQDFDSESGENLYHNYLRAPLPQDEAFNIDTFPEYFFTFTSPNTWNKLIRRSIFTDNNIQFDSLRHINDVTGTFLAMAHARRIVLLNKKLIFYRMNRGESLMATYGEQTDAVFTAYSHLKSELESRNLLNGSQIRQSFNNKVWDIFIFTCRYCNSYSAFETYIERLKGEWLPAFQMENLSKEYFYNADRGRQYEYMYAHTAGDMLFELFCFQSDLSKKRNQKAMQFKAQNKKLQRQGEIQLERIDTLDRRIFALKEKVQKKNEKIAELKAKLQNEKSTLEQKNKALSKAESTVSRQNETIKQQLETVEKQKAKLNRRLVKIALKISNILRSVRKRFKNER